MFVVAVCLQGALAKKATAKPVEKSQLEELSQVAQNVINNVTSSLGIQEIPDSKQVVSILNNQTQTLASNVQTIVDQLKTEFNAHKGEIDGVIKQVSDKLTETANNLQNAAGPEATAKAKELKSKFETGLKDAYDQIEKLVKAVEPNIQSAQEGVSKVAKSALDTIVFFQAEDGIRDRR